ncbi:hypothetical protein [Terricaulis silvestris]|uniref:Uncharacterized protein n=1 Tax=Terricaulis silvestris TaxID=2686094 RepID=A0A6I6MQS2_9CAUL|nr:hypothetical protein [Terricaulis silvestris]QGZ95768.1 hypothetical protein DSM104635_02619 [Terricaulis silvestris]
MSANESSSAKAVGRRYTREMLTAAGIYSVFVFAGAYAVRNLDLPQWAVIAASLAPLLPALLMLRAYATFLRGIDEFQRRIQTDAILIAAAIVGFGSFAYGFLEEWADFPHLPLIWVFPALIGTWGLAACIIRLRYK